MFSWLTEFLTAVVIFTISCWLVWLIEVFDGVLSLLQLYQRIALAVLANRIW
jgi:hypothetical protein